MTVTSELVIARHGEARCNVEGRVGGPKTCTGLTDLGRRQIARLATRLATEHRATPFAAVYAGPRLRLRESGQILAAALDLPFVEDPGLDGPRHGEADGATWREVEAAFHGAPHTHPERPYAPGADSWNSYLIRATRSLAGLLERIDGQRVLLAAHGETIHAACHHILGIPLDRSPSIDFGTDHASLTRFKHRRDPYGNTRWVLEKLNDTGHLTP